MKRKFVEQPITDAALAEYGLLGEAHGTAVGAFAPLPRKPLPPAVPPPAYMLGDVSVSASMLGGVSVSAAPPGGCRRRPPGEQEYVRRCRCQYVEEALRGPQAPPGPPPQVLPGTTQTGSPESAPETDPESSGVLHFRRRGRQAKKATLAPEEDRGGRLIHEDITWAPEEEPELEIAPEDEAGEEEEAATSEAADVVVRIEGENWWFEDEGPPECPSSSEVTRPLHRGPPRRKQ